MACDYMEQESVSDVSQVWDLALVHLAIPSLCIAFDTSAVIHWVATVDQRYVWESVAPTF